MNFCSWSKMAHQTDTSCAVKWHRLVCPCSRFNQMPWKLFKWQWETDLEHWKEGGLARNRRTWRTTTWWVWGSIVLCPIFYRHPQPRNIKKTKKQTSKACILAKSPSLSTTIKWSNPPVAEQPIPGQPHPTTQPGHWQAAPPLTAVPQRSSVRP